jgi:hypothetical protein
VKASAAVAPKAEATALLQEEGLVAKQFHDKDRRLYASGSFFVSDPPETKLTSIDSYLGGFNVIGAVESKGLNGSLDAFKGTNSPLTYTHRPTEIPERHSSQIRIEEP